MGVRFAIDDWAACAPGLTARDTWQAWARDAWLPEGALEARVETMPALQRRRLNPLGRAVAQVAWECHEPSAEVPVVLASSYGDAQRCLQLLKDHSLRGDLSPTEFALSVHNAIGALYSIARQDGAGYTSLAAGPASAALGVVEAAALLADGAGQVLLVCYDAPLPGEYAGFANDTSSSYAWAWRVSAAKPGEPHFELTWTADDASAAAAPDPLPFGLQALRFVLSGAQTADAVAQDRRWQWRRHA